MPFFAAQAPTMLAICGMVWIVRTIYGERSTTTEVEATVTTIGTLASVASGATAIAIGVTCTYLVYRATVEGSFTRDSGAAGLLDVQGEFLRSVEVMDRLLREYPPEPYAAEAELALAQRIYAKAAEAARDATLRRAKVNRVVLLRRAGDEQHWGAA